MAVTRRQRALGQNLIADPNLVAAIVRDAGVGLDDVVLEVGAGEGAVSRALAPLVGHLHAIELDRRFQPNLAPLAAAPNVSLRWGDAMRIDLAALRPKPTMVVSNLPYSIATPLIVRTIELLPGVRSWTLMVQREIADRLRARPGSRLYGAPSVVVQLAAEVELLRKVDPAVFRPRPRISSALLALRRRGPAAPAPLRDLVRQAFAHRRKPLARSLELAKAGSLEPAREALRAVGLSADARAETLSPDDFVRLYQALRSQG